MQILTLGSVLPRTLGLLACFSTLAFSSYAQEQVGNDEQKGMLPAHGLTTMAWQGAGVGNNTLPFLGDLAASNPAALVHVTRLTGQVMWQHSTEIPSAGVLMGTKSITRPVPIQATVVFPWQNFRFAAGYSQRYQTKVRESIDVENVSDLAWDRQVNLFAAAASYTHADVLAQGDGLTIGTRIGLLRHDEDFDGITLKLDGLGWMVGLHYALSEHRFKPQIGLFFEQKTRLSGEASGDGLNRVIILPNQDPPPEGEEDASVDIKETWPRRFGIGSLFYLIPDLGFRFDFQRVLWEDADLDSQSEFAFGLVYEGITPLTLSLSYYRAGRDLAPALRTNGFTDDPMRADFLVLGVVLAWQRFQLDLAVSDSHWLGSERTHQTLVKAGLAVSL